MGYGTGLNLGSLIGVGLGVVVGTLAVIGVVFLALWAFNRFKNR